MGFLVVCLYLLDLLVHDEYYFPFKMQQITISYAVIIEKQIILLFLKVFNNFYYKRFVNYSSTVTIKEIIWKCLMGGGLIGILFGCSFAQNQSQFDKTSAFSFLEKQCSFGPRNPGSNGHRACLEYFRQAFLTYTPQVELQQFMHRDQTLNKSIKMTNVIVRFPVQKSTDSPVLLCAHWDSRPMADRDPDIKNRTKPIPAANDGASGVAVLLEIAHCLKNNPASKSVTIVLFDGEDYGTEGHLENYCLGSKYFASQLTGKEYQYGILLDMVGDKNLSIPMEAYSVQIAPDLVESVWSCARRLKIKAFQRFPGNDIYDDHRPLIEAGIPTIDIIDFDYPYWHTLQDTPDKCSPESLKSVGDVLLDFIYNQ